MLKEIKHKERRTSTKNTKNENEEREEHEERKRRKRAKEARKYEERRTKNEKIRDYTTKQINIRDISKLSKYKHITSKKIEHAREIN